MRATALSAPELDPASTAGITGLPPGEPKARPCTRRRMSTNSWAIREAAPAKTMAVRVGSIGREGFTG